MAKERLPWFRVYGRTLNNKQLLRMSEALRWRWIALLCVRCNEGATLHDFDVPNLLRISPEEWAQTKAEFVKNELIDNENNILNWEELQFLSDDSTERSKKHRENKKLQRDCNVASTASDTDTDTDTDIKKINKKDFIERNVGEIFNHWVSKCPDSRSPIIDDSRRRAILKMLEFFSVENLKLAIDGCALDPFYNGDTGVRIDSIEIIFKNATNVEKFINIAKNPPKPSIDGKQDNYKYDTLLSENNDDKVVKFVEILKRAEMQCRYNLNVEEIKMYYDELKTFCLRSISFAFSKFQTSRTPYDGKFPKVSLLLDFARIKQNKFEEDCARIWEEVLRYIERKWKLSDLKEGSTEHLIFNNSEFRVQFPENLEELLEDASHRDYSKRDLYKKKFIELYLKIEGER